MIVFPLVAALISVIFALALLRQFSKRRRFYHLTWGVALLMFAAASLAVAGGVGTGWDPTLFRIYWLFGALLNVPWLALGSIALLGSRLLTLVAALLVVAGSVWGLVEVFSSPVNPAITGLEDIPRGSLAWSADPGVRELAQYYSIPSWALIVLIAAVSGRRRDGVKPPVERVRANWIIAAGVSIVAIGGFALARLAQGAAFSVTLALGVVVMFTGFLMAQRAPAIQPPGAPSPERDIPFDEHLHAREQRGERSGPPWGPPPAAPSG